jgi:hypothetical protein
MADELVVRLRLDTDVIQKQINNLKLLVDATGHGAERSEFHRGWCACLDAVLASMTVPVTHSTMTVPRTAELPPHVDGSGACERTTGLPPAASGHSGGTA